MEIYQDSFVICFYDCSWASLFAENPDVRSLVIVLTELIICFQEFIHCKAFVLFLLFLGT